MEDNFGLLTCETDPLLQHLLPGLAEDIGESHDMGAVDLPERLWQHLTGCDLWQSKLEHVSTNRFFGAVHRGGIELGHWSCRLYGAMSLLIERGELPGADKKIKLKLVKPDPACRSTAKQREAARAAKDSTKNVLELVYLMYSDIENRWLQEIITNCCRPVMDWHTCHNLACRASEGTQKWAGMECSGGYLDHLRVLASLLRKLDCVFAAGMRDSVCV